MYLKASSLLTNNLLRFQYISQNILEKYNVKYNTINIDVQSKEK